VSGKHGSLFILGVSDERRKFCVIVYRSFETSQCE